MDNNHSVKVVLLGLAQDGGVPQAGCSCNRCMDVHNGFKPELFPVSLGIMDKDGAFHIIEASRTLSRQLFLWAKSLKPFGVNIDVVKDIKTVCLTHLHLGHIDGLGLFGREVMGCEKNSVRLISSSIVLDELEKRSLLDPFSPTAIEDKSKVSLGSGVTIEFHRVPHREEEGGDMHGVVIRGDDKSILFLPDHDTYEETLQWQQHDTMKGWFKSLSVQIVLIDGTFYSSDEVLGRRKDATSIPHPSIQTSLKLFGNRTEDDPDIIFIHLNHTNTLLENSTQVEKVTELGWQIGKQGQVFEI